MLVICNIMTVRWKKSLKQKECEKTCEQPAHHLVRIPCFKCFWDEIEDRNPYHHPANKTDGKLHSSVRWAKKQRHNPTNNGGNNDRDTKKNEHGEVNYMKIKRLFCLFSLYMDFFLDLSKD
jgi:hypothetical protein